MGNRRGKPRNVVVVYSGRKTCNSIDLLDKGAHMQGSEWSAEEWNGLARPAKVKSSPMVGIRPTGQ